MMRKVTEGISVKTVSQDAMARQQKLLVTVPPIGSSPSPEVILEALDQLREGEPRTLAQAKNFTLSASIDGNSLTPENASFVVHAQRQIDQAEKSMLQIPAEYQDLVVSALDEAFRAGISISTVGMRQRFLGDVTTQAKMKVAQREGGERRRGVFKDDTEDLVRFMNEKISKGQNRSEAGRAAFVRPKRYGGPLGTSPRANAERYRIWMGRQMNPDSNRDQSIPVIE